MQSIRLGSYDHYAAIYYLLLDKLRNQLINSDASQSGNRLEVRRRPSNVAEQAMRKINRASTSEDCRRLLHSTAAPTASNSKIDATAKSYESPSHGIDAAKLLSATTSEDALKILQQATTPAFNISTEATKLMSTLQQMPVSQGASDVAPFRDYVNHMHTYSFIQVGAYQPTTDLGSKGSLHRFCSRYV